MRHGLPGKPGHFSSQAHWEQDRFTTRARALFFSRLTLLTLGLLVLAVPEWRESFGLSNVGAFAVYFAMLLWSIANYMVIGHYAAGRVVTYVTLCLDLIVLLLLIAKPQAHVGSGLQSPLLATQLLYTVIFALLFPKPLAVLPPLLLLPVMTRLDQILDRPLAAPDVLTLLWYSGLNVVVIYVLVYLNGREALFHREVVDLQGELQDLAVVEERNRLSREIHDGLGASLSALIIQAEYVQGLSKDPVLTREVAELRTTAEESIEELRRNLRMMRDDFDIAAGVEEYVRTFGERTQAQVTFTRSGLAPALSPERQLALFRVLQEALANAVKHAPGTPVSVALSCSAQGVTLEVRDKGKGFDPDHLKTGHYGLVNMRERAAHIGAQLTLASAPDTGTKVAIFVPLPTPEGTLGHVP